MSASLDIILVADDERRFVEINQAAVDMLGLPRSEVLGRRVDEFFAEASGVAIPEAWASFVAAGVQSGICELKGKRRLFVYRAKANFVPGLHVSVLQDAPETGSDAFSPAAGAGSEP